MATLNVSLPDAMRAWIYVRGSRRTEGRWQVFDKRYWPGQTLADHLTFAIRHEGFDPLILKRAFDALDPSEIEVLVEVTPTGALARRIWFLFESMTGQTLDLPDAPNVAAVNVLDPDIYFTASPTLSRRHRVRDNLLGSGRYCPVIRRTRALAS